MWELLLEGQLNLIAVELHQLPGVLGHQAMHDHHLLGAERSTLLELVGEAGEDLRVHATEAHRVVVAHDRFVLLVRGLIAEDGEECALSPADVGGEFALQCFEGVGFIHHTYIMLEPYGYCNSIFMPGLPKDRLSRIIENLSEKLN